jgi:hypothetical protein
VGGGVRGNVPLDAAVAAGPLGLSEVTTGRYLALPVPVPVPVPVVPVCYVSQNGKWPHPVLGVAEIRRDRVVRTVV